MIFTHPNIDISIHPQSEESCLLFEFKGKFTEEASIQGTSAWSKYITEHNEKFIFIWDCTKMEGFELGARKTWYETMKQFKNRIIFIHVIAENILIRSAAKVMLNFFGLKGEVVRTLEELHEKA